MDVQGIASAALNLYLVIHDDVQDEGIDELAELVAAFANDYGVPCTSLDSDDLLSALRNAVADHFGE